MADNLVILAAGASMFVKILIDLVRMSMDVPRWLPPTLALLGGILIVLLMQVAGGTPIDTQRLAESALAGILAGGAAVGVSEVGKRADARVAGAQVAEVNALAIRSTLLTEAEENTAAIRSERTAREHAERLMRERADPGGTP